MSNESRKLANELARKRHDAGQREKAAEQARKAQLSGELATAKREREVAQAKALAARQKARAIPGAAVWLALSLTGILVAQGVFIWRSMNRPKPVVVRPQPVAVDDAARKAAEAQVQFLLTAWNEDGAKALAPYWSPALPPWLRAAGEARLAAAPGPLDVTVEEVLVEPRSAMRLAHCRDAAGNRLVFRLSGDPEKPALLGVE
jgi:hypothetical protein